MGKLDVERLVWEEKKVESVEGLCREWAHGGVGGVENFLQVG